MIADWYSHPEPAKCRFDWCEIPYAHRHEYNEATGMGYFKPTTLQDVVNNTGETRMELPDWYTCGCGEMGVHEWYSRHKCWFTEGECARGKHKPHGNYTIEGVKLWRNGELVGQTTVRICEHCSCLYPEMDR